MFEILPEKRFVAHLLHERNRQRDHSYSKIRTHLTDLLPIFLSYNWPLHHLKCNWLSRMYSHKEIGILPYKEGVFVDPLYAFNSK